jgi:hypothetical protein
MTNRLKNYKPSVNSTLLVFLAGTVWLCVGAMLLFTAYSWLIAAMYINPYAFAGVGIVIGLLVHHFGLLRVVDKNLSRILLMDGKKCLFSFIPWKGYLVILLMVAMGAILRNSGISGHYLAVFYIGMGLALILSSIRYMRIFFRLIAGGTRPGM